MEKFNPSQLIQWLEYERLFILKKVIADEFLIETQLSWVNLENKTLTFLSTKAQDINYEYNNLKNIVLESFKDFEEYNKTRISFSEIEFIRLANPEEKERIHKIINH